MIIKQLSIFLENKSGRLAEVATILGANGINMSAFSIADTSDFGILRVIVSNPDVAYQLLKKEDFSVQLTDVVCLNCPNEPDALAKALRILNDENIAIEYLYAFSVNESANVVLKPTNVLECIATFQKHKLELIAASDLYKL